MNDKEFIAALKDMDNDTLMDNLEDLGGDAYYQELRSAIIAEIRKRLADTEGEYIKIDDLDDTVLRLNNDGWEITRNEHKLISNVLYEMPLYSFPNIEKGEWILVVDSYYEDGTIKENHWECSKCGSGKSGWGEYKFCPNCGADMRGKAE